MGIKRDISAILIAHRMDPGRKELYVEGATDKLFIMWIAGDELSERVLVHEISNVLVENDRDTGNRGRLLEFAERVVDEPAEIRFLVDKDFDPFLPDSQEPTANVWSTDGRDIESYFLREECFEKVTLLAIGTELYSGHQLLASLVDTARSIACLRLYSSINKLDLAFQATAIRRSVTFESGNFLIDIEKYVTALLQNSGISISEVHIVISRANEICVNLLEQ